jgi:hypothetical protein
VGALKSVRSGRCGALRREVSSQTRRFLDVSTGMVSQATCRAACEQTIVWANTTPTSGGFLVYAHDERQSGGFDDLWAVLQFARGHGCDYVMFDADASTLSPDLTGLPVFDW